MFEQVLAKIARALDEAGIPYMVIGGQAVLIYGEPRLTRDVDITLGVSVDRLPDVLEVLRSARLRSLVDPQAFVGETMVLPCQDEDSPIRVDLIFSDSAYEQAALRRARKVSTGGESVRFVSPEDLVIHKIIAGRPRDLEDVRQVLIRNPTLDHAWIRRWLGEFEASLEEPFTARFEELARAP